MWSVPVVVSPSSLSHPPPPTPALAIILCERSVHPSPPPPSRKVGHTVLYSGARCSVVVGPRGSQSRLGYHQSVYISQRSAGMGGVADNSSVKYCIVIAH